MNNSNGLGFNGYDEKGREKWDLLYNVDIYNLEVSYPNINFVNILKGFP